MKSYYKKGDWLGEFLKNQRLKNVLPVVNGRLLDIACGDNQLVQNYGNGIGIDIQDYGADFVFDNFFNLPFQTGEFDTVTILSSLNYFEEPVKVLSEIHRVMKTNGQLVITNTNAKVMSIWHKFRESWAHKSGYSEKDLGRLMESAGFIPVKKKEFNLFLSYVLIAEKAK